MRLINLTWICAVLIIIAGCSTSEKKILPEELAITQKFNPQTYLCYQSSGEIVVDGKMDEDDWEAAAWTNIFVDIEAQA